MPRKMCLRFVAACALFWALTGLAPGVLFGKTKYLHTKVGNLEVLSSGSAEASLKLMYELLEVREQIKAITGSAVVPDPAMLVVVFESERAFDDFMSANAPKPDPEWRSTSLFWRGDSGLTMSLIKGDAFAASREVMLIFYANYLLTSLVPHPPLWISVGLPEYLSTVEYRRGKIELGTPARDHRRELRVSRLLPLASLCDDGQMNKKLDPLNHKTVLYHEAWAFWHFLLTDRTPARLEAVRRIFAALRRGETADGATVGREFGMSLDELQAEEKKYLERWKQPVAQLVPAGERWLQNVVFAPASDLDRKFALAVLFGRAGKGLGSFGLELLNLAQANPGSPRPYEAMANLAQGDGQTGDAERYWERALENGSTNSFAYLLAARRHTPTQQYHVTLRAELPEILADQARGYLDKCLALNPGAMEAYAWLAGVEAFAPTPRLEAVNRIEQSQAQALYPSIAPQLAVAWWRLGEKEKALRLVRTLKSSDASTDKYYAYVRRLMEHASQPAETKD